MTLKITKGKASLLTLALGTLVATSLSAGAVTATGETAKPNKGLVANPFRKVCTGALFSKTNFRLALKACVKNYPQDMKKFLKDLEVKKQQKEGEITSVKQKIEDSLANKSLASKRLTAGGDANKELRKKHVEADPKSKLLYKRENELVSEVRHLTEKINAINAAFDNRNLPS